MARHHTCLIVTRPKAWLLISVAIVALLLLPAAPAGAQSGSCPDYTNELNPAPIGSYPGTLKVCAAPAAEAITVVYADDLPCGGGVSVESSIQSTLMGDFTPIVLVPPANMPFLAGSAHIRFEFAPIGPFGRNYTGDVIIEIVSYSAAGNVIATMTTNARNHAALISGVGQLWYIVDFVIGAGPGGYFSLQVVQPAPLLMPDYFISSLQVADGGLPLPCSVPGAALPTPTPTPAPATAAPTQTPSPSPTGTWQPTSTTQPTSTNQPTATATAWPTAAGGTVTPFPTNTPYRPIEVPAESTGTPLPGVYLPTPELGSIDFPGVTFPTIATPGIGGYSTPAPFAVGLTPDPTTAAQLGEIGEWVSDTQTTADRWITSTNTALGWFSPDVTTTTGISSPIEIADTMTGYISQPIGYVRSLAVYMPNIWPYVLAVFLMLLWVFLNLLIKFGLAIVSEVMELIRKTIELIPGM